MRRFDKRNNSIDIKNKKTSATSDQFDRKIANVTPNWEVWAYKRQLVILIVVTRLLHFWKFKIYFGLV